MKRLDVSVFRPQNPSIILGMNVRGNEITIFHDNSLQARAIMGHWFTYVHRDAQFKKLKKKQRIKVEPFERNNGLFICEEPFINNDYIRVVYNRPITAELIDIYINAMAAIEHSVKIRESFEHSLTYQLNVRLNDFLMGHQALPEFDPNMPVTFLTIEDKLSLRDHFETTSYYHALVNDRYMQPALTPGCVPKNNLQLTLWHQSQIDGASKTQHERAEPSRLNEEVRGLAAPLLMLFAFLFTITIMNCHARGLEREQTAKRRL